MPKATIAFNLPDERSEYALANKAGDLSLIIYDFSNELRARTKHGDGKKVDWEEVREMWWKLLQDYNYDPYSGDY